MTSSKIKTIIIAIAVTFIALSLVYFPGEALEASKKGLTTWWSIVFPSLLPFFIISELLIGFGVVKFLGVLFEPLMRPIFKVPGVGGFVWAMGLASGNPAGAKLTTRLRQEKQLTAVEAERLVSFTSSANPLFIFAAVATGFFANETLGIILALSHYLGNIFVGIIMRFHGKEEHEMRKGRKAFRNFSFRNAFNALHLTRINETRPFGKLLGDAVISSVQTLLMIGGFIILFSVFNKLLSLVNITDAIAFFTSYFLSLIKLPSELSIPLISGIFEVTIGSQMVSETKVDLFHQLIVTSFLLAFSGLSIQAQVASILAETDIRFKPFFIARIIHGCIAAMLSFLLWKPFYVHFDASKQSTNVISVFLQDHSPALLLNLFERLIAFGPIFTILSLSLYTILYARRLRS